MRVSGPAPAGSGYQASQGAIPGQRGGPRTAPAHHAHYRKLIPDLRPGERVVVVARRHPAALWGKLVWPVLLALLWLVSTFFVLPLLSAPSPDPLVQPESAPVGWLRTLLMLGWLALPLVPVAWTGFVLLAWSGQWTAITTHRLIMMDKVLFLRETRREAPLAKVQNVVADFPNALGMSLNFGNLSIDTAGVGVLIAHDLPNPRALRETIFTCQMALKASQATPEERRRAAVQAILTGAGPAPQAPEQMEAQPEAPTNVPTYGWFDVIFPISPQRNGLSVVWHKHWFFLFRSVALPLLIFGVALLGWIVTLMTGEREGITTLESVMGWIVVALFPVCMLWALWKWEDWRNDLYRLDRERVYHIESLPFGLREQSKETLISRITDVTYLVPSLLANLLNYGDVVIKTPGEATEFVFARIPNPREVQQEIMARLDEHRLKEGAGVDREIEAWIRTYHAEL